MDVNRAFIDKRISTPNAIQQLRARQHTARAFHQELEKAKFGRTQPDFSRTPRDTFCCTIEADAAVLQNVSHAIRC